jgi:hypothetical protein
MSCIKKIIAVTWISGSLLSVLSPCIAADYTAIQKELETMSESDQSERGKWQKIAQTYGENSPEMKALWAKQEVIDTHNLQRLEQIIAEIGWPGKSQVGRDGAEAAFLIIQHSDTEVQKKYIPLLRAAVEKKEAKPSWLALMEDRIRVNDNQPQIYGSQLHFDETTKSTVFYPIEDEKNVDIRRAKVGLQPIAEYAKFFGTEYHPPK